MQGDPSRGPLTNNTSAFRGAYGLSLKGDRARAAAFGPVDRAAPSWEIAVRLDAGDARPEQAGSSSERVVIMLSELEWALCDRAHQRVTFHLDRPVSDEILAHPMFAAVGVCAAHWRGDTPLHAGGVVLAGHAWAILGDKQRGKSTTMAECAARGLAVLADDLLVVTPDLRAHAGPRAVDLRGSSAARYPEAVAVEDSVMRERFRLPLPDAPPHAPLAGIVTLAWGPEVALTPVPVVDRIGLLADAYALWEDAAAPRTLLELAHLPFYELARPQELASLPATIDALMSLGAA